MSITKTSSSLNNALQQSNNPTNVIQYSSPTNTRNHIASVVRLTNGNLLCVWAHYAAASVDWNPCQIWAKISINNGLSWGDPYMIIDVPSGTIGYEMPSIYKKTNGNIIFIGVLRVGTEAPFYGQIWQYESIDNGATFSGAKMIYESSDYETNDYISCSGHSICVTQTGRLLFPFNMFITSEHSANLGNTVARVLYSDDEGENWSLSATVIQAATSGDEGLLAESNIAQETDGTLIMIHRTRSMFVRIGTSINNGATWDNPPVKEDAFITSNAMVRIAFVNGKYIGVANRPSEDVPQLTGAATRVYMDLWESTDGTTWAFVKNLLYKDSVYVFAEPVIYDLGTGVLMFYSHYPNDDVSILQDLRFERLTYADLSV